MFDTFRIAFQFLKEEWKVFAAMVCLIWAGGVFIEYFDTNQSVLAVAWAIIAYQFHRALLFHETSLTKAPTEPVRPVAMGRFIFVSILLLATALIFGVIAGFAFVPEGLGSDGRDQLIGVMIIASLIANLLLLSVFGTALPAAAAADKFGFGITLRRARTTWARTLWRMLTGPGLFWAVYLTALIWFLSNVFPMRSYYDPRSGFDMAQIAFGIVTSMGSVFGTLLAVIVLCRAYHDVAPDDVRAVMIGPISQR